MDSSQTKIEFPNLFSKLMVSTTTDPNTLNSDQS